MTTKTKIIIGVSAVLTLGAVAYFTRNMWMPKKDEKKDEKDEKMEEIAVPPTPPIPVVEALPVLPILTPPAQEKDRTSVSAVDLLAGGLNNGNKKGLYANYDGLLIYNDLVKLAFKSKKGQRLGTIYKAEKGAANNIWISFVGPGGIKYKAIANGTSIK